MEFPLYHLYVDAIEHRNQVLLIVAFIVAGMLSLLYLANEIGRHPRFTAVPKLAGLAMGVIYYASLVAVYFSLGSGS